MLKVGDRVKIKSKEWYLKKAKGRKDGRIVCNKTYFTRSMAEFCGRDAMITGAFPPGSYNIDIDGSEWFWSDEMFEYPETPGLALASQLTKRELFAAMALQGLAQMNEFTVTMQAKIAVKLADELLNELNKQ